MRAIIETVFDIFYLAAVLTVGIRMIRGSKSGSQFKLFGLMAVVLGAGDSFHLVPRALALCTTGLENYAVPLGLGKWITSITMTVFYVLLYYVWRKRYQVEGQKNLTIAVYALSAVRVLLCMMPQNQWLTNKTSLTWGILRNVPFALLGLLIIVLFYRSAKDHSDKAFRWMWLTIVLSFGFYIPVVLWADVNPLIGMLTRERRRSPSSCEKRPRPAGDKEITDGIFIDRPKRFIAHVDVNGVVETVHDFLELL